MEQESQNEETPIVESSKSPGPIRYLALVLVCLVAFGSYFCFDNPAALADDFKNDLKISTATFSAFYSWYSFPNIVMCFFSGFLIDRVFGVRLGSIIYLVLALTGQLLFATGAYVNKIFLMDVGRFVLGIGSGSLSIITNTYAVRWFFGKELNFVFGILISFSRLGSTCNFLVMTPLYELVSQNKPGHEGLGIALFIASLTIALSLASAICLAFLDKKFKSAPPSGSQAQEKIKFSDVLKFPISLWLVFGVCVTFYSSLFPFVSLSKVFYISKYGFEPGAASRVSRQVEGVASALLIFTFFTNVVFSFIYVASAVGLPTSGALIDFVGYNPLWTISGILLAISSHLLITFSFVSPYVTAVMLGISYALMASSLWPMVALIVARHQLSTAYGLMFSVQSAGLAAFGVLAGIIVDETGYFAMEVFFLALLCLSLICAFLLFLSDRLKDGILGMSRRARNEMLRTSNQIQKLIDE